MSLLLDSKGKPNVVCPKCGRLHLIRRNKGYTGKPIRRFNCTNCQTSWLATEEQQTAVMEHYKVHHENLRQKNEQRKTTQKDKPAPSLLSRVFGVD
jgi:ssDNA-binding Zn-finger/Zn-ribbon topoisomerase 1